MNLNRVKPIFIVLISIFIFYGCSNGQTSAQVKVFSLASTQLSQQIIQAYELTNKTSIQRKVYDIALLPDDEAILLNNKDIDAIKGVLENKKNQNSMKALKALNSYSKALGELSSVDISSDMMMASKEFYGSLGSLENSYKNLSKKDLKISNENFAVLSTLINAVGTKITEDNKEKAIKEIVMKTDPFISSISNEIFNNIGNNEDFILANMRSTYNDKILIYRNMVKNGKLKNVESRVKKIKDLMLYSKNYKKAQTIFKDIKLATKKLENSHHILYKTLSTGKKSNDLKKQISQLVSYSKQIKANYKSLLDENK